MLQHSLGRIHMIIVNNTTPPPTEHQSIKTLCIYHIFSNLILSSFSNSWRNIIDPVELNMENYSKEKPVWGFSRFVRKSQVPKEISIGISLQGLIMSTDRITVPVSRSILPTNLIEAWEDDINNMDISDIKFVVKGRPIYARRSILRRRSEYF